MKKVRYTTLMFSVILVILAVTILILSIISTKSASSGLYKLGDEALHTVHTSMMSSLTSLNDEIVKKLRSDLTIFKIKMMAGEPIFIDVNSTASVGNVTVPVMKKVL